MKKNIIINVLIMLLLIIFTGILSVHYGIDRSADMRNYHIYNPWAFFNNRLTIDIMPADIQSYFNPILDIPYYLMVKYFNNFPRFVTFLCGLSSGIYLFLVYKISEFIFKDFNKIPVAIISVIVASGTQMFLARLGWMTHDMVIADLILISMYMIFKSFGKEYHPKLIFSAGLILGCATGLKYTSAIFSLPLTLTFIIFYKQFTNFKKSFGLLILGAVTGVLISDGFWMYRLYMEFGNPFFPYFNWLFHSDFINISNVYSLDFANKSSSIKDIWRWPFFYQPDLRFKVLWSLVVINILTIPFIKKEKFEEIFKVNVTYVDFMLTFISVSYVIWLYTFAVTRYFAFIMGLAGLLVILVSLKLFYILNNIAIFVQKKFKIINIKELFGIKTIFLYIILIIIAVVFFPNYKLKKTSRLVRVDFGEKLMDIKDAGIPDTSVVFVQRGAGMLIPFQNPYAKYIHLNASKMTEMGLNIYTDIVINKIKKILNQHPDNIYFLTYMNLNPYENSNFHPDSNPMLYELDRLGLNTYSMQCRGFNTKLVDKYNRHKIIYKICKIQLK